MLKIGQVFRQLQHVRVVVLLPEHLLRDNGVALTARRVLTGIHVILLEGSAQLQHVRYGVPDRVKGGAHVRYSVAHLQHVQILVSHQLPQSLSLLRNPIPNRLERVKRSGVLGLIHDLANDADAVVFEQIFPGSELELDRGSSFHCSAVCRVR